MRWLPPPVDDREATAVFQAYVREILLPVLRPGDIVILDNLGAHKNELTLELIRQAGAEARFLPALLPGPQPHRNDVEQGEGPLAQGAGPHPPRFAQSHRPRPCLCHTPGCPRLVCRLWL